MIDDISEYLNLNILTHMDKILETNNCPRSLSKDEYLIVKNIKQNISSKYLKLVDEMNEIHQAISNLDK